MVMADAVIHTSKGRDVKAEDFFCTKLKAYANLEPGELITEVSIPKKEGWKTGYQKLRLRPAIDFAIISLAWGVKMNAGVIEDARLVLGAVAPVPVRLSKVEAYLKGRKPDAETAETAAEMAVEGAQGIGENAYKIDEIKAYVRRMVEALA